MNLNVTKIELSFPVDGGITELMIRRPKVRDMLVAEKLGNTDAEREIGMFANLCEVAPATIEGLDMADYIKLQKVYSGFLSSVPATPGALA